MSTWKEEMDSALRAFELAAELAGHKVHHDEWKTEYLDAPHQPPRSFPKGLMAIYGFWGDGHWLKIGMAGAKSQARYTSQHYLPGSAPSTLAASLAKDARMAAIVGFDSVAPGAWIKEACHRVNILLPVSHGRPLLALLEAFLHVRLSPRHER